jgi:hypothetical protein
MLWFRDVTWRFLYAGEISFLVRSVLLCMHCYNVHVSDVFNNAFTGSVWAYVQQSRDGSAKASAGLLVEALELKGGILQMPHSKLSLTRDDVNDIMNFICTS